MITVYLGGSVNQAKANQKGSWPKATLNASHPGAFPSFLRRALESTKQIYDYAMFSTEPKNRRYANDDFSVVFEEEYVTEHQKNKTLLLKLASAVEVALDLHLDVQVVALSVSALEGIVDNWPSHWPQPIFYGK